MTADSNITLVGMPGAGKTTFGKQYAHQFGLPFYDLDHCIEALEGVKIHNLIAQKGMDYFRQKEHDVLVKFLEEKDWFLLSVGGGTPCFYDNMTQINRFSKSVFLDVSPDVLLQRLHKKNQQNKRPLLAQKSKNELEQSIQTLYKDRLPFYQQAQIRLQSPDLNHITKL